MCKTIVDCIGFILLYISGYAIKKGQLLIVGPGKFKDEKSNAVNAGF